MDAKDVLESPAAARGVAGSVFEDDVLRDGSSELERARAEFRLGHLDVATGLLDALALRLKPKLSCAEIAATYAASRVLDARIHDRQGRAAECREALGEALAAFESLRDQLDSVCTRAVGDYGIALEMLGRHQEAALWLQKARDTGLDTQSTFHFLGLAQKALGDPAAAATLAEAEKRDPEDAVAIIALGDVLLEKKETGAAAEAYWRASVKTLVQGDYPQSLQLVERAASLRPENPKDLGMRAVALWKLGKLPDALSLLDRAIAMAPPDLNVQGINLQVGAWRVKARILLEMRRFAESLEAFEKSLAGDPSNGLALAGKANALVGLGRYQEALPWFEQALARDPRNQAALLDCAALLRRLQQYDRALQTTTQVLQAEPDSLPALSLYGHLLRDRGEFSEAAARFRRIVQLNPASLPAYLDLADALIADKRPQEALEALDQAGGACRDLPPDPAARLEYGRGQCLARLGRFRAAAESFRRAYELTPALPHLLALVDTLRELGDDEAALVAMQRYLAERDPAPPDVLVRQARLLADAGEFAPATRILDRVSVRDAGVCTLRGFALENQGVEFAPRALEEYREAARQDPANLWRQYHVANAMRVCGQRDEALEAYRGIAAALEQRLASTGREGCDRVQYQRDLWLLGWSHLCQGQYGDAVRYLTAAASCGGGEVLQFDLALAFLCDGRVGLAEREYAAAIEKVQKQPHLRQRGLLLVAIQDILVAARCEPQFPAEEGTRIVAQLQQAAAEIPLSLAAAPNTPPPPPTGSAAA